MREVKRIAKVGEKIKIIDAYDGSKKWYKNGDVLTVKEVAENAVFTEQIKEEGIWHREYVVLEGYVGDFTKSDLKDGDIVRLRNGINRDLIVFDKSLLNSDGGMLLISYRENMEYLYSTIYDIMEVYRNGELIFDRVEKSPMQIEIESIEEEQRKLANRLSELRKGL